MRSSAPPPAVDVGGTEESGQRLLDDHVLARARGGDGDLVVAVGGRAHVDDVDVGALDELAHVGEHARDAVVLGKFLDVGPRARADGRQPDARGNQGTVVDGVQVGREARADDADAESRHGGGS